MAALCQLDDNLVPGQTYTFQLKDENRIMSIRADAMTQDITNYAPSFIGSLQVSVYEAISSENYNVQFTYQGDGSDVVSDVANSLIAAVKQGGDSVSFIGAVPDTASTIDTSIPSPIDLAKQATDSVTQAAGDSVNKVASKVAKTASDTLSQLGQGVKNTAQDILTPVEIAVGVLALIVVLIIFTSGKAGGVSGGPEGVKIGG